jgi:hypothetical protein
MSVFCEDQLLGVQGCRALADLRLCGPPATFTMTRRSKPYACFGAAAQKRPGVAVAYCGIGALKYSGLSVNLRMSDEDYQTAVETTLRRVSFCLRIVHETNGAVAPALTVDMTEPITAIRPDRAASFLVAGLLAA